MPNETVGRLKKLQAEAQEAFDDVSLAHRDEREQTRLQRILHFWLLVARSFVRNRCPVRASSLAYASLLAIVPMLAVVIGVSSSFLKQQGEEPIERFVEQMVASVTPGGTSTTTVEDAVNTTKLAADTRREITQRIMEFVRNVRSGTLSVTGVVALLVVAISMLSRIEETFNDIWGVTRGRTWTARVTQYWGAITLGPILWAAAVALTSGPYFESVRTFLVGLGPLGVFFMKAALWLLPYLILSLAFTLLYLLMPNTKVHWRAAAVAGVVAGCLWQLNQEFSVFYVSRVVSNTSIYGSLGAVPVFMIGLYVSWVILLFGAQVAYAFQNRRAYLQERQVESINQRSREFVALRLMAEIGRRFQHGEKPPTLARLADAVGVPTRLVNQTLAALIKPGLVVEITDSEAAFAPAKPLAAISAQDILYAMRVGTGRNLATHGNSDRAVVIEAFDQIGGAEQAVAKSLSLEELVTRLGARTSA
jgi:membrane protein